MGLDEGPRQSQVMAKPPGGQGVIRVSQGHPTPTTASLLETVAEQVVEEGHQGGMVLAPPQHQQVVMVTQGGEVGPGGHQLLLTTTSEQGTGQGQFGPGTQLIQLQGEQYVMRNLKSEPEDLSVQQQQVVQHGTRTINLEAGAQAIQASAAAAVQNVIRSLKDSDKMMLQQILPNHMLGQVPRDQNILIVEGGGGDTGSDTELQLGGSAGEVTPIKRSRSSGGEQVARLQIAKQYTPFGFHCMLEAGTAQWIRKDEDRCTYLNKVIIRRCREAAETLTRVFQNMDTRLNHHQKLI